MYGASMDIFNVHVQQLGTHIILPNFVQIGPSATQLWRHIQYPRRWPRRRNSTSGFVFRDSAHLERSKSTRRPNRRDILMHDWDITTSGFWKQTSAMLEFYFRFRFLRFRHHRQVILHLATKFCPNRTIRDRVVTSYIHFQDCDHGVAILLPVSVLGRSKSTCVPNF